MRNLTKASREASRAAQFSCLISDGYTQETYKSVEIFTNEKNLLLKTFHGTAANHTDFIQFRTIERLREKVQEVKDNLDRLEAWKAKQKEENKGKKTSHAAASAAIKAELSKAFPSVKFSVRSDSFSMGNSVDISWQNGPTVAQVEAISQKYQYGSFNGMEDIYETTNYRDDIPQAKWVSEHREVSEELIKQVAEQLGQLHKFPENDYRENADQTSRRLLYKTEIPATYTGVKVCRNEKTAACYTEDFYFIEFEGVQQPEQVQRPEKVETAQDEIKVIEYSQFAVAIIGKKETIEPIKEDIKKIGAVFNSRLTCGPAWILSKKKIEQLHIILQAYAFGTEKKETVNQ